LKVLGIEVDGELEQEKTNLVLQAERAAKLGDEQDAGLPGKVRAGALADGRLEWPQ